MNRIRLVFASSNPHKISEVTRIAGRDFVITGLDELGFHRDIPEPYHRLEKNALAKARFVHRHFGSDCFADDTGLEVDALGGAPGAASARYAGEEKDPGTNMEKLLRELSGKADRQARFRTVIALIWKGREYLFEGLVRGHIAETPAGEQGFGYDPVFIPLGYEVSFAQMDAAEKNSISHRRAAIDKMLNFLRAQSAP